MQDPVDDRNINGLGQDAVHEKPKGTDGVLFDIARKAVAGSVRSLLSSEEGLRALIGTLVPKEIGQTIMRELSTQMATLRTETVKAVIAEFTGYLSKLDPALEVQRILSGLEFSIQIKVGVDPKEIAAPPTKKAIRKPAAKKKKAPARKRKQ